MTFLDVICLAEALCGAWMPRRRVAEAQNVRMALHGIPFFVLCTQSQDGMDEKAVRRRPEVLRRLKSNEKWQATELFPGTERTGAHVGAV